MSSLRPNPYFHPSIDLSNDVDCTGPKLTASQQHFTHILSEFEADLVEGVATDLKLSTDFGGILVVHKCLATQLSPLLKSLLDDLSDHISSVIILPDVEITDLDNLVQFLYTGKCSVSDQRSVVAVEELLSRLCIYEKTQRSESKIQEDNVKDINPPSDPDYCPTCKDDKWQVPGPDKDPLRKEAGDERNNETADKRNKEAVIKKNKVAVDERNKEAVGKRNNEAVGKWNKGAIDDRNIDAVDKIFNSSSQSCTRTNIENVKGNCFQVNGEEIRESNMDLIYLSDSSSEHFYDTESTFMNDVNNNTNNEELVLDTSSENVMNDVNTKEDSTYNSDTATASHESDHYVGNNDLDKEQEKSVILAVTEDDSNINMEDETHEPLQCPTDWDSPSCSKTIFEGDWSKTLYGFNNEKYLNNNREESLTEMSTESTLDVDNCSSDVPKMEKLDVPEALYSRKVVHGRNGLPLDVAIVDYSDCEMDWISVRSRRYLMDLKCPTPDEKEIFSRWNSWILKRGAGGNRIHLSKVLKRFIATEGQSIMRDGLYRKFVLHLATLQQMNLIDSEQLFFLSRTIQILPKFIN